MLEDEEDKSADSNNDILQEPESGICHKLSSLSERA